MPIFKISIIQSFYDKSVNLIIENTNNVYYRIDGVTFSIQGVEVVTKPNGHIRFDSRRGGEVIDKTDYYGLGVTLSPENNLYYEGNLRLKGRDLIGKDFQFESNPFIFMEYKLENKEQISKTYLNKI